MIVTPLDWPNPGLFQVDQPLRAVIVFLAGFETEGGAPELGAEFIMRK